MRVRVRMRISVRVRAHDDYIAGVNESQREDEGQCQSEGTRRLYRHGCTMPERGEGGGEGVGRLRGRARVQGIYTLLLCARPCYKTYRDSTNRGDGIGQSLGGGNGASEGAVEKEEEPLKRAVHYYKFYRGKSFFEVIEGCKWDMKNSENSDELMGESESEGNGVSENEG